MYRVNTRHTTVVAVSVTDTLSIMFKMFASSKPDGVAISVRIAFVDTS